MTGQDWFEARVRRAEKLPHSQLGIQRRALVQPLRPQDPVLGKRGRSPPAFTFAARVELELPIYSRPSSYAPQSAPSMSKPQHIQQAGPAIREYLEQVCVVAHRCHVRVSQCLHGADISGERYCL